jgi:hypothetical protein
MRIMVEGPLPPRFNITIYHFVIPAKAGIQTDARAGFPLPRE